MRDISVFDTTLRDGEQAPGNGLTPDQRLRIAEKLERLGVDAIEAGFPAASKSDYQSVEVIARAAVRAQVSALSRPTRADIDTTKRAFGSHPGQILLLLTGSELHAHKKRSITPEAALDEAREGIRMARKAGFEDISLGLEDGSRATLQFLHRYAALAMQEGATSIIFADTVGCLTPPEVADTVSQLAQEWPELTLGCHFHNDLGLASANTLQAIASGCTTVHTTIAGIGERAGNAPLEEVATALSYKADLYDAKTNIDLSLLFDVAQDLADMIGERIWKHKPILGEMSFSTAAGIHANGLIQDPETYEYVRPQDFGRKRRVLLSRSSGVANLRVALTEADLPIADNTVLRACLKEIVESPTPLAFNDPQVLRELIERHQ